jgi:transposase
LKDDDAKLSGVVRLLLAKLKLELEQWAVCVEQANALIPHMPQESEMGRHLDAISGIGPITETALIAPLGNAAAFRKSRDFAAWMGLVPRGYSTGGKQKLRGIGKRGICYLRKLFVQGARSVLQFKEKQSSGLST